MSRRSPSKKGSWIMRAVAVGGVLVAGVAFMLYSFQDKLIYMKRRYNSTGSSFNGFKAEGGRKINYNTSQGVQYAYILPSVHQQKNNHEQEQLWVILGGNAALAMDWLDLAVKIRDTAKVRTHILLVDYPGYGANQGDVSPATIVESVEAAVKLTRKELHMKDDDEICLLGHSLGAASSLLFLSKNFERYRFSKVILLSPFTSMESMVRLFIGRIPGIGALLRHKFDNLAAVDALRPLKYPLRIHIIHGRKDEIIPYQMGVDVLNRAKGVAQKNSRLSVLFTELPNAHHNDILSSHKIIDHISN
jgi:pimeloyl-ACP methyl ester carboxylesterase